LRSNDSCYWAMLIARLCKQGSHSAQANIMNINELG